jgi:tetratricopeptide (TPR) repeat protein
VTILPGFLFAPWLLGSVAWDAGLAILLVSVVNLHHFVLDGAIWKLRDGKVAQLLLRDVGAQSDSAATPVAQRSWFRPAMAVLGVASLAIASIDLWEREYVINRSGVGEIESRLRASQWLAWIGRENPDVHTGIAQALADRNEPDAAIAEYRRSLALHPTPDAWLGLGEVQLASHRWSEASESFAAVLVKEPDHLPALVSAGVAWMNLGQPDRARESFARARSLAPRNAAIQKVLQQAESAGY